MGGLRWCCVAAAALLVGLPLCQEWALPAGVVEAESRSWEGLVVE